MGKEKLISLRRLGAAGELGRRRYAAIVQHKGCADALSTILLSLLFKVGTVVKHAKTPGQAFVLEVTPVEHFTTSASRDKDTKLLKFAPDGKRSLMFDAVNDYTDWSVAEPSSEGI